MQINPFTPRSVQLPRPLFSASVRLAPFTDRVCFGAKEKKAGPSPEEKAATAAHFAKLQVEAQEARGRMPISLQARFPLKNVEKVGIKQMTEVDATLSASPSTKNYQSLSREEERNLLGLFSSSGLGDAVGHMPPSEGRTQLIQYVLANASEEDKRTLTRTIMGHGPAADEQLAFEAMAASSDSDSRRVAAYYLPMIEDETLFKRLLEKLAADTEPSVAVQTTFAAVRHADPAFQKSRFENHLQTLGDHSRNDNNALVYTAFSLPAGEQRDWLIEQVVSQYATFANCPDALALPFLHSSPEKQKALQSNILKQQDANNASYPLLVKVLADEQSSDALRADAIQKAFNPYHSRYPYEFEHGMLEKLPLTIQDPALRQNVLVGLGKSSNGTAQQAFNSALTYMSIPERVALIQAVNPSGDRYAMSNGPRVNSTGIDQTVLMFAQSGDAAEKEVASKLLPCVYSTEIKQQITTLLAPPKEKLSELGKAGVKSLEAYLSDPALTEKVMAFLGKQGLNTSGAAGAMGGLNFSDLAALKDEILLKEPSFEKRNYYIEDRRYDDRRFRDDDYYPESRYGGYERSRRSSPEDFEEGLYRLDNEDLSKKARFYALAHSVGEVETESRAEVGSRVLKSFQDLETRIGNSIQSILKGLATPSDIQKRMHLVKSSRGAETPPCSQALEKAPDFPGWLANAQQNLRIPAGFTTPDIAFALDCLSATNSDGTMLQPLLDDYASVVAYAQEHADRMVHAGETIPSGEQIEKTLLEKRRLILQTINIMGVAPVKNELWRKKLDEFINLMPKLASRPEVPILVQQVRHFGEDPLEVTKLVTIIADFIDNGMSFDLEGTLKQMIAEKSCNPNRLGRENLKTTFIQKLGFKLEQITDEGLDRWNLPYISTLVRAFKNLRSSYEAQFPDLVAMCATVFGGSKAYWEHVTNPDTKIGQANIKTKAAFSEMFEPRGLALNYDKWLNFDQVVPLGVPSDAEKRHYLGKMLTDGLTQGTNKESLEKVLVPLGATVRPDGSFEIPEGFPVKKLEEASVTNVLDYTTKSVLANFLKYAEQEEAPNMEFHLWKRQPGYDIFQGTYAAACTDIGGGTPTTLNALESTFQQIVELYDKTKKQTVGKVVFFWERDVKSGMPIFVFNTFEGRGKASNCVESNPYIRDKALEFARMYSQAVAGRQVPITIGESLNPTYLHDMGHVTRDVEVVGACKNNKFYLDALKNNGDPISGIHEGNQNHDLPENAPLWKEYDELPALKKVGFF